MPDHTTNKRISESLYGKLIALFLAVSFGLLATAATDGKWYSYFLPFISIGCALLIFIFALIKGIRLPKPGWLTWAGLGCAGYFFIRAFWSDEFFLKWSDLSLIVVGCVFYIAGFMTTSVQQSDKWLFRILSLFLLGCVVVMAGQYMTHSHFTVFRPSFTLQLKHVWNVGFFGYKNFTSHFLSAGGFFCLMFAIIRRPFSFQWLSVGFIAIIASFFCSSRSAIPNTAIGILMCWALYTIHIRQQRTKANIFLIAGLITLITFAAGLFIAISQNGKLMMHLSSIWTSGGRYQLSSIAYSAGAERPLFGHGSMSYENIALPSFSEYASPNMAHNEYAQCFCEYGSIGLLLLIALLVCHYVIGLKNFIRTETDSISKAKIAASMCLLTIAAFHASIDFIWHNGAILSMGAYCLGILSTNKQALPKAAKLTDRIILGILAMVGILFSSVICAKSYPFWNREWAIASIPEEEMNGRLQIVKDAMTVYADPSIITPYASILASAEVQQHAVSEKDFAALEQKLREALNLSPHQIMAKTYLGVILSMRGQFEEADSILEPFTQNDHLFDERVFPWRTIYLFHLTSWIDHLAANGNKKQALNLIQKALDRLPLPHVYGMPHKSRDFENKLKLEQLILEQQLAEEKRNSENILPIR